jgi:hypothetical protein
VAGMKGTGVEPALLSLVPPPDLADLGAHRRLVQPEAELVVGH